MTHVILIVSVLVSAGCNTARVNPSMPVSLDEARQARMALRPQPLDRPVVIVDGYLDPGLGSWLLRQRLEQATRGQPIISVSLMTATSFEDCRERIIAAVDARLKRGTDPAETPEVDVIGISMGGLAAAHAGTAEQGRRLNIRRLFTISSPWRGATKADLPTLNPLQRQMRSSSDFIRTMAERDLPFEVYPYVGLDDGIVGEHNAAPAGREPIWVAIPPLRPEHSGAVTDDRIVLDILLRLTRRAPVSILPAAPLPGDGPPTRG